MRKIIIRILVKLLLGKQNGYVGFVGTRRKPYVLTIKEYVPAHKELEELERIVGSL